MHKKKVIVMHYQNNGHRVHTKHAEMNQTESERDRDLSCQTSEIPINGVNHKVTSLGMIKGQLKIRGSNSKIL